MVELTWVQVLEGLPDHRGLGFGTLNAAGECSKKAASAGNFAFLVGPLMALPVQFLIPPSVLAMFGVRGSGAARNWRSNLLLSKAATRSTHKNRQTFKHSFARGAGCQSKYAILLLGIEKPGFLADAPADTPAASKHRKWTRLHAKTHENSTNQQSTENASWRL